MSTIRIVNQLLEASGMSPAVVFGKVEPDKEPEAYKRVEKTAIEKALQLHVPERIRNQILQLIKPIGLEQVAWYKEYYHKFWDTGFHTPVWTPQGTIDKFQSTRAIVEDPTVQMHIRFAVACIYCHDVYIPSLQKQLTKWDRLFPLVQSRAQKCSNALISKDHPSPQALITFWMSQAHWRNDKPLLLHHSDYVDGFEIALECKNETAVRYFFKQITPEEREAKMLELGNFYTLFWKFQPDLLCSLFSVINKFRKEDEIHYSSFEVLDRHLDWPWQSYFLEAASSLTNHLSPHNYLMTLSRLAFKMATGFKDYNYPELFTNFWNLGSHHRQTLPITHQLYYYVDILFHLFDAKDTHNIQIILREFTTNEKEKLVTCDSNLTCEALIRKRDWEMLECFFRECLDCKDVKALATFKEMFKKKHPRPTAKPCYPLATTGINDWKLGLNEFDKILDKLINEVQITN